MDFIWTWTAQPFIDIYNAPTLTGALTIYAEFMVVMIVRLLIWFFALMTAVNKAREYGEGSWQYRLAETVLKPLGGRFIAMDIIGNYHISLVLLQLPIKWNETISERHGRYLTHITLDRDFSDNVLWYLSHPMALLDCWRYNWAKFWCDIIGAVDPGHCIRYAP